MPAGRPLRRTLSNTTASEHTENCSSPSLCNTNIYRMGFCAGKHSKYVLITPASVAYTLFVLNTKESRNQYCVSCYGSTFEAVLHLQRNRPTSEFSQYLSRPWPPSGLPLRCYASALYYLASYARFIYEVLSMYYVENVPLFWRMPLA